MKNKATWQTDWETFVRAVVDECAAGKTPAEITKSYCDQPVEWRGRVIMVRLDDRPAVNLEMPPINVVMPDGRHGVTDYLNLKINSSDVDIWKNVALGMNIRFSTTISCATSPFPSLEWAEVDDDRKGYLSIATKSSLLLEIVETGK